MKYLVCLSFIFVAHTSWAQSSQLKRAKVIWVDGKPHFDVEFEDGEVLTYQAPSKWSQWDMNPIAHFLSYSVGWTVASGLTKFFKAPVLYQFIRTGGGALVIYIGFIDAIRVGRSIYQKFAKPAPHEPLPQGQ